MVATFVLQKSVVDELFIREDEFQEFVKFLKMNFRDYLLITDFEDEEDFIFSSQENPLFEIFMDRNFDVRYVPDLEDKLRQKVFFSELSPRTLVVSALPEDTCKEYLDEHGILLLNIDLLKSWDLYSEILYVKTFKVTRDVQYPSNLRLNSFDDISKYFKYCSSIIIFDRYLFCDRSDQKIANNLNEMIISILKVKPNINIMIISEFKNRDINRHFDDLESKLASCGFKNYTIRLVHHSKAFYPKSFEGLHSRFIISNYVHIRSNDSFNFFKSNGQINNLVDIDVSFSLNTRNSYSYLKDLEAVGKYLNKLKNEPKCPKDEFKILYHKDKSSHLIN